MTLKQVNGYRGLLYRNNLEGIIIKKKSGVYRIDTKKGVVKKLVYQE